MKLSNLFPSPYFKAVDLADGSVTLKIESTKLEKMGDGESKPVLRFVGQEKGLVLNKTNGNMLCKLYGDDTDDWVGRLVQLTSMTTEFSGKVVDCIRLRPPLASDELKAEFD
jgi:hypothetical protein